MRVLVAGRMAGAPHQGGAAWAVLQYVHGFRALGHDVMLVEPAPVEPAILSYFRRVVASEGLAGTSALLHPGRRTTGVTYSELLAWRAEVLVNLAGVLADPDLTGTIPHRIYVDLDPAFTQLWHHSGINMGLEGHTHFATVGRAIGTPRCEIPTCGVTWTPTAPPIVTERWPATKGRPRHSFTTLANWRSYGSITHGGVHYGQKAHAVRRLIDLPRRVRSATFEPAFAIDPTERRDLDALAANGWRVLDPAVVAATPERYRRFVESSFAEIGIAKSGYLASRCGWFSDRSVCYLASGRPVVGQDTGWSDFYPSGEGLLAFQDADVAADAALEVLGNYTRHRKAARALAEEFFEARRVLPDLLAAAGVRE